MCLSLIWCWCHFVISRLHTSFVCTFRLQRSDNSTAVTTKCHSTLSNCTALGFSLLTKCAFHSIINPNCFHFALFWLLFGECQQHLQYKCFTLKAMLFLKAFFLKLCHQIHMNNTRQNCALFSVWIFPCNAIKHLEVVLGDTKPMTLTTCLHPISLSLSDCFLEVISLSWTLD